MGVVKKEASDLVVYGVTDLRRMLGIGRPNAYRLLRELGRRVGRRLVVARAVLERWLAREVGAGPRRHLRGRPDSSSRRARS
jgi:hypothetical protein